MSSRILTSLAVAAALAAPIAANADSAPGQPKGDWLFRVGVSQVNPESRNLTGSVVDSLGANSLTIDSDISPTFNVEYMLTNHLGTELLLAWPFTHGIDAKGNGGTSTRVAQVDLLPPTLSLNWHFNMEGKFRPYIGAGINYSLFSGEKLRGAAPLPSGSKLNIDDAVGFAGQIGLDVMFEKNWFLNASVRYIDLSTDVKVDVPNVVTPAGASFKSGYSTVKVGTADINPIVTGIHIGYQWGSPAPLPVAALPPPPPPPPPPAKCADSDNDGVCDSVDRCPNTPAGDRVGPFGCSCDVTIRTHFAFDSAELTAEDKAQLEKVAVRLKELEFVEGVANGHTDSIGDPAYNMKLSERRAQAVVDYLASKGVAPGRMKAVGYGETKHIADNSTEEGRAQNRRVTIHRTDCGPSY
jgi:outer membrane protein